MSVEQNFLKIFKLKSFKKKIVIFGLQNMKKKKFSIPQRLRKVKINILL